MRCFTEAELRRGLEAVRVRGNRCTVCDGEHESAHRDRRPHHPFAWPDLVNLFLEAARDEGETADGEG